MTVLGGLLRLLPFVVATAAVVGVVHIGTIFAYPDQAHDDAFTRIATLGPTGTKIPLPPADAGTLPSRDPAMASAVCRYDLAGGPFRIAVNGVGEGFLSFGMHDRHGTAFYGLNLRAGEGGLLDLVLMTAQQKSEAEAADDDAAGYPFKIVAPEPRGFVVIDAPADGPAGGQAALDRVTCGASAAMLRGPAG